MVEKPPVHPLHAPCVAKKLPVKVRTTPVAPVAVPVPPQRLRPLQLRRRRMLAAPPKTVTTAPYPSAAASLSPPAAGAQDSPRAPSAPEVRVRAATASMLVVNALPALASPTVETRPHRSCLQRRERSAHFFGNQAKPPPLSQRVQVHPPSPSPPCLPRRFKLHERLLHATPLRLLRIKMCPQQSTN